MALGCINIWRSIMKQSFSLSVFLAFSSLVTVSSESQAQNVPQNILQRINEINITNPSITKEIQFPILRCKNQIARKKIIEDYLLAGLVKFANNSRHTRLGSIRKKL